VDDLKAIVPALGPEMPAIAAWLTSDENFSVSTGIGCSSASMQMSDSRVALHAANFMATLARLIRLEDHRPGIGVAVLDADGPFARWTWITEEPFRVFSVNESGVSWEVRVRKSALL